MSNALLVVAHPDDETIFFGGWVYSTAVLKRKYKWTILCVTDGNGRGQGASRMLQFHRACKKLGAQKSIELGFADNPFARLPQRELQGCLQEFATKPWSAIYTHGPLGEYGHPHHQDVCRGVHEVFARHKALWSVADHQVPEVLFKLEPKALQRKWELLVNEYADEFKKFWASFPTRPFESFARHRASDVRAMHDFLSEGKPAAPAAVKAFRHVWPWVVEGGLKRQFEHHLGVVGLVGS